MGYLILLNAYWIGKKCCNLVFAYGDPSMRFDFQ